MIRIECTVLVWKPVGKRPLTRPKHRWENIKRDLQEVDRNIDWIDIDQNWER